MYFKELTFPCGCRDTQTIQIYTLSHNSLAAKDKSLIVKRVLIGDKFSLPISTLIMSAMTVKERGRYSVMMRSRALLMCESAKENTMSTLKYEFFGFSCDIL